MQMEVVVAAENDTAEDGVNALIVFSRMSLRWCEIRTTNPNEYKSDGLLSSPLKCPSGLRQLALPANIPLIHLGFGRYAAFSKSETCTCSITISWSIWRWLIIMLSGLISVVDQPYNYDLANSSIACSFYLDGRYRGRAIQRCPVN
jgi:hypothetical protein